MDIVTNIPKVLIGLLAAFGGFMVGVVLHRITHREPDRKVETETRSCEKFNPHTGALRTVNDRLRLCAPTYDDGEILPALLSAEAGWEKIRPEIQNLLVELAYLRDTINADTLPHRGMGSIAVWQATIDIIQTEHLFKIRHGVEVVMENGQPVLCAFGASGKPMIGGKLDGWVSFNFGNWEQQNA